MKKPVKQKYAKAKKPKRTPPKPKLSKGLTPAQVANDKKKVSDWEKKVKIVETANNKIRSAEKTAKSKIDSEFKTEIKKYNAFLKERDSVRKRLRSKS
jgi:hypothetical protein